MNFGNILGDIGHFFGGMFGGNNDDERRKQEQAAAQRQQQQQSAARLSAPIPGQFTMQPTQPGVQMPKPFQLQPTQPNQTPQLGGVSINQPAGDNSGLSSEDQQTVQHIKSLGHDPSRFIAVAKNAATAQDQSDYNNSLVGKIGNFGEEVGKDLIGTTQQGLGMLGDTAVQGGGVLSHAADSVNPFLTPAQRAQAQSHDLATADALRAGIHSMRDISGNPIAGTSGADQAGANIAAGHGTLGDFKNLGMTALNTGLAGTLVDPAAYASLIGKVGGLIRPAATEGESILANNAVKDAEGEIAKDAPHAVDEISRMKPAEAPAEPAVPPRDPNSPITSPTVAKVSEPAITSPNRPAPTVQPPRPVVPEPAAAPPVLGGVEPVKVAPPVVETAPKIALTPDEETAAAQAAIDQQAAKQPVEASPAETAPVETKAQAKARVAAEQAAPPTPEAVAAEQAKAANEAPTEAIAQEAPSKHPLGSITRQAVRDGSINTPEGVDTAVSNVTTAAHAAAKDAGTTLDDIIKKGQAVWEENPDATPEEASKIVSNFTPEQQKVYKDYGQELHTLRDRSGHSLNGGNQGAWYGPRQFLDDEGKSTAYDPSLVNELRRTGVKTDSSGRSLDYSATPYEHYIRRYANAADAAQQRLVDAAENSVVKGDNGMTTKPTGVKVPEAAKEKLSTSLKNVTDLRDQADRLRAEGDTKGAKAVERDVQKETNKAFNEFMQDIPGKGSARNEALKNVKAMRGNYEQSLTQTLTLSNVVNRAADQGTKLVETLKRPLVRGLEKTINPLMKGKAMDGAESYALNTTKEARQAAHEFAKGTLGNEMRDNAQATLSMAGAGRNPLIKGVAKADAAVRAGGGALTQAGDLSTANVREALQIGASRPEAQGLKTVEDYKKYFADYTKTQQFRDDLARVEQVQNPKIGLAGGEIQKNGGTVSNALSKHVDNFVSTQAEKLRPGLGKNRIVREVNDLVKGNVTGYSGVTSRVLGTFRDALVPIKPLRAAVKEAGSGDPAAAARATKMASHAVADTIALYGTAGAAALLAKSGVVGYTGSQAKMGSSDSAYNKSNGIPSNQWYVNIGDKRVYFDPARPAGAAGIGADIAGSIATGANVGSTASNVGSQVANQAGGSSLPDNYKNVMTGYFDPSASDSEQKYSRAQVESLAAPSTGVLNNVANWTDPTKRAPTNFSEDLRSNIPGLRAGTPVAKDSRGNAIPNSKQISGGSSLFSVGKNTDAPSVKAADPVGAEIARLQKTDSSVFPTNSNTNAKANKNTQDFASTLLKDPLYTAADDAGKASMMKDVLQGTSTKDINSGLSSTDKQALLDAKLVGNKQKAWLDDNKNAANYYTADYNNAKANGTLTDDDNDLNNKSGKKYAALEAQVNQKVDAPAALKQSYHDTSYSEWKAMLDEKSDSYDPETATKLYNYDKARTEAGVSGNSADSGKLKFDLAKLQAANAKKAASGSKNFAFANLPASLVGSGTGGSGGGKSGYASAAPLFTPIPDLKTPTGAAIPKGRTISVKSGV